MSAHTARATIVLAGSEDSDTLALRIVLSLAKVREESETGLAGHVVVEVNDLINEPLVRLMGGASVETVVSHDVIGRLMLLCARQPGLAFVLEDLLGFQGAEFHMRNWPQLKGRRFGEVLRLFPDAVPVGVARDGKITLNPTDDYVMEASDDLMCVAEDAESYKPIPVSMPVHIDALPQRHKHRKAEKVLFCGWRRDMAEMIKHLNEFVARGSTLWVVAAVSEGERRAAFEKADFDQRCLHPTSAAARPVAAPPQLCVAAAQLCPAAAAARSSLINVKVTHMECDLANRVDLEAVPLETFDSALILASEVAEGEGVENVDSRRAPSAQPCLLTAHLPLRAGDGARPFYAWRTAPLDSRALATLLLIRDIQTRRQIAARPDLMLAAARARRCGALPGGAGPPATD